MRPLARKESSAIQRAPLTTPEGRMTTIGSRVGLAHGGDLTPRYATKKLPNRQGLRRLYCQRKGGQSKDGGEKVKERNVPKRRSALGWPDRVLMLGNQFGNWD